MRAFLRSALAGAALCCIAHASTFAVGNEYDGKVFIFPGATLVGTPGGIYDMALDSSGNYIVAPAGPLLKMTPGGVVTTIASGGYISVAVDGLGNFIAADNSHHEVWRISPDGSSVNVVAAYPVCNVGNLEDVTVRINSAGNYVVMHDNCSSGIAVYVITPGGTVTSLPLSTALPSGLGGFTFSPSGNYVIDDYSSSTIYSVTPSGTVSVLSQGSSLLNGQIDNIVYDPGSGNYVVANKLANSLLFVTPAGAVSTIASGSPLNGSIAVVLASVSAPPPGTPAPATLILTMLGLAALTGWLVLRRRYS